MALQGRHIRRGEDQRVSREASQAAALRPSEQPFCFCRQAMHILISHSRGQ